MWVINVFSGDRRRPIVDRTSAICPRSAWASLLVPEIIKHQSSAYAEARVMPTSAVGWPGQGGGAVLDVGIILRGSLVICLSGSCQWFLQTGR